MQTSHPNKNQDYVPVGWSGILELEDENKKCWYQKTKERENEKHFDATWDACLLFFTQ